MDIYTQNIQLDIEAELFKSISPKNLSSTGTLSNDDDIPELVNQLRNEFDIIYSALENQKNQLTTIMSGLKKYHQKVEKKLLKKINKEKKRGITKPCVLSDKLCDFLGKCPGSKMSRTDVTKNIHEYIKKNNLFYEKDRRYFITDKTLSDLLDVELGDKISFFSIQQKMNVHYNYTEL
jgi:chromatin remodeling complex protein RSC6